MTLVDTPREQTCEVPYVPLKEAARRLGLSVKVVRRRIREGRIQAHDFGSPLRPTWFVSEDEIERYLRETRQQGGTDDDPADH